jgi:tetratricopeptide (TPR) repeat protein
MQALASAIALCLWALLFAACSAPAQIRDLQDAENHERAGRHEDALQSYQAAQASCLKVDNKRRRRDSCAAAHLQRAELLVTMKRHKEALEAYHEAERALVHSVPAAAQACYDAGLLYLEIGEIESAYRYLWRTITNYPNEAFAADALKRILRDGRKRAPEELRRELLSLGKALSDTKVADNLLHALAELEENEFQAPDKALERYDLIVDRYPKSGLFDDSLWHSARLSRQLGDSKGAVKRLRKLVGTREVALGAGSYFSVWLDDGQLELGIILRDDLKDYKAAIKAFSALPSDYPASILRDDALYERALTKARAGQKDGACKDLAKLNKKYPDSKYTLAAAPKLRSELACAL